MIIVDEFFFVVVFPFFFFFCLHAERVSSGPIPTRPRTDDDLGQTWLMSLVVSRSAGGAIAKIVAIPSPTHGSVDLRDLFDGNMVAPTKRRT